MNGAHFLLGLAEARAGAQASCDRQPVLAAAELDGVKTRGFQNSAGSSPGDAMSSRSKVPAGMTPTMRWRSPSSTRSWFKMPGSPPNRACHAEWLSTTTGAAPG